MLGYGQTDKPDHPEEYSLKKISGDLELILSECKVESAVSLDWVGHGNRGITGFVAVRDRP